MQKQKNKTFVLRLMSLFVIVLVISAAAILRDGKLLGHDMGEALATSAAVAVDNDTLEVLPDGAIVVNTRLLAKDVQGYGGPVALRIHIDKGGVVDNIEAEPNADGENSEILQQQSCGTTQQMFLWNVFVFIYKISDINSWRFKRNILTLQKCYQLHQHRIV